MCPFPAPLQRIGFRADQHPRMWRWWSKEGTMRRDHIAVGPRVLAAIALAAMGLHRGTALGYDCARMLASDAASCVDSCPGSPGCQSAAADCGGRGLQLLVRSSFDPSTGVCACEGSCQGAPEPQCTPSYCSSRCPSGVGECVGNVRCECICTASWCRDQCQQRGYATGSCGALDCACYGSSEGGWGGGGGGGGGDGGGGWCWGGWDWDWDMCFGGWDEFSVLLE